MKNPLNDIRSFCAVCAGATFAFGFSACMTIGFPPSEDLFHASIFTLIITVLTFIGIKVTKKWGEQDSDEIE